MRTQRPRKRTERLVSARLAAELAKLGRKGGRASMAKLSAKERSEKARAAVMARWAKAKRRPRPQGSA
jgi:hypothetical protein